MTVSFITVKLIRSQLPQWPKKEWKEQIEQVLLHLRNRYVKGQGRQYTTQNDVISCLYQQNKSMCCQK